MLDLTFQMSSNLFIPPAITLVQAPIISFLDKYSCLCLTLGYTQKAEPARTSMLVVYLGGNPGIRSEGQAEEGKKEIQCNSVRVRVLLWAPRTHPNHLGNESCRLPRMSIYHELLFSNGWGQLPEAWTPWTQWTHRSFLHMHPQSPLALEPLEKPWGNMYLKWGLSGEGRWSPCRSGHYNHGWIQRRCWTGAG